MSLMPSNNLVTSHLQFSDDVFDVFSAEWEHYGTINKHLIGTRRFRFVSRAHR